MKINKIKATILTLVIALGVSFGLASNAVVSHKTAPHKVAVKTSVAEPVTLNSVTKPNASSYKDANSLDIVANPAKYLNKRVRIKAKFDKFSTLGLDYKPAYRSSEKYISFLIKRDDVVDHTIPLSEMKIFMTRKVAEKHIDLDEGDEIEIFGLVFSDALGDAWVEVEGFNVLTAKKKVETSPKK